MCKSYAPTTGTQLLCHAALFCSSPLFPQPGLLLLASQGPLQTYNQEKKKKNKQVHMLTASLLFKRVAE